MALRTAFFSVAILCVANACLTGAESSSHALRTALDLFNQGKYQECYNIASAYVRDNPESAAGHKILGMDQFMLGQSPREALKELQRATELAPKDADAFYYLGRLYFTADNPKAALQAYQTAADLDPLSVRTRDQMGQTYEALGQTSEAEQAYRKAIELDRDQPKKSAWPYYNLGVLYWNTGRKDQAIPYFRQALERNSALSEAKVKLAVALSGSEGNGDRTEAHRLLDEVVRTDPANAEGHYRLALLLNKEGKRDQAASEFSLFEKYRKP